MKKIRYSIAKIVSEEILPDGKVKATIETDCYGRIESHTIIRSVEEWEQIKASEKIKL